MSFSAESPPAGWYPDPAGSGGQRYWDGSSWSQVTRPANTSPGDYVPQEEQAAAYSPYGQSQTSESIAPGQASWGQAQRGYGTTRQPVLAGFWWRVLAAILDSLITSIPFGLVVFLLLPGPIAEISQFFDDSLNAGLTDGILPQQPTAALTSITLLMAVLMFVYRTVMVALRGATLGKLILGMRVLQVNAAPGTNPSWGVSALRAAAAGVLGQIPVVNIINPLVMLFTARKQTLHDMLARTIVYKK